MPGFAAAYVAQVGCSGRPTLEHNMETLHWVREILEKGADWFASQDETAARACAPSRLSGAREEARRASRARRHYREGADRRVCGGMLEGQSLWAIFRAARRAGFSRHQWPISRSTSTHPQSVRLLHRLGGRS